MSSSRNATTLTPITNDPPKTMMKRLKSLVTPSPSSHSAPSSRKQPEEDLAALYGVRFAQEVALRQMFEGGSTAHNVRAVQREMGLAPFKAGDGRVFACAEDEESARGLLRPQYTRAPQDVRRRK